MSKLWITEFASLGSDASGLSSPIPQYPPVATQTPLTLGATQQSAAFNAATRYVRLRADGDCHFVIGSGSFSATVNDTPLDANAAEYIAVHPGMKLAVIIAV